MDVLVPDEGDSSKPRGGLAYLIPLTIAFSYGTLSLITSVLLALLATVLGQGPPSKFWDRVEIERERIYSLSGSKQQPDGKHGFFKNKAGHVSHYLTFGEKDIPVDKTKTLVIFFHGYPDCCHMWHTVAHELAETRTFTTHDTTKLIAVDLPGFGGSGCLSRYGPPEVLGTLVQFVQGMRERYLPNGQGRVVVVSHDWGGVLAWRLNAEAPEIADSFIIANAPATALVKQNLEHRFSLCRAHLQTWMAGPTNFAAFGNALNAIRPCLRQLSSSHYIFIFSLPHVMSRFAFGVADHYFSFHVARLGVASEGSPDKSPREADGLTKREHAIAAHLGGSLGPNQAALSTSLPGSATATTATTYAADVRPRVMGHYGHGNVSADSIRYYQDNLSMGKWKFDANTQEAIDRLRAMRGLKGQPNAFAKSTTRQAFMPKAETRVVWGALDMALDRELMLEGMEEWVGGWENIVVIKSVGHWTPSEQGPTGLIGEGTRIIAKSIADAVDGR